MRIRLIIAIFILSITSNAHALDLSRVKTWAASEILTAADLNAEFNNILNHSITNNDIGASAAIVCSKLDLSTSCVIGGTTPAAGSFTTITASSTLDVTGKAQINDKLSFTQSDDLEYIDSLADGYLDFEATTGLRFRINATEQINLVDGKLAPTTNNDIDLGDATHKFKDIHIAGTANFDSVNIDGGTLDGVQIGGTTATGELIVNDSNDDADGLGSQGTSGQFLISQGTGANPTFSSTIAYLSSTPFSAAALTGNISITQGKRYLLFLKVSSVSTALSVTAQFDDDSAATVYGWTNDKIAFSTTPTSAITGDDSDSDINITDIGANDGVHCTFTINADLMNFDGVSDGISMEGVCIGWDGAFTSEIRAIYKDASTLSSIEFYASTGNMTGTVILYELQ